MLTCHSCGSQFSFKNSSHVECPHQSGESVGVPSSTPHPPSPVTSRPSTPNSDHLPQTESLPSWNVSMDTQGQQLTLHFSSRTHATFSAAWSDPGLGIYTLMPPVYSISQVQPSWALVPTRFSWPMHIPNVPVTSVRPTPGGRGRKACILSSVIACILASVMDYLPDQPWTTGPLLTYGVLQEGVPKSQSLRRWHSHRQSLCVWWSVCMRRYAHL